MPSNVLRFNEICLIRLWQVTLEVRIAGNFLYIGLGLRMAEKLLGEEENELKVKTRLVAYFNEIQRY